MACSEPRLLPNAFSEGAKPLIPNRRNEHPDTSSAPFVDEEGLQLELVAFAPCLMNHSETSPHSLRLRHSSLTGAQLEVLLCSHAAEGYTSAKRCRSQGHPDAGQN